MKISSALVDCGFAKSASDVNQMIKQGAVSLDGIRVDVADLPIARGSHVLRVGEKAIRLRVYFV